MKRYEDKEFVERKVIRSECVEAHCEKPTRFNTPPRMMSSESAGIHPAWSKHYTREVRTPESDKVYKLVTLEMEPVDLLQHTRQFMEVTDDPTPSDPYVIPFNTLRVPKIRPKWWWQRLRLRFRRKPNLRKIITDYSLKRPVDPHLFTIVKDTDDTSEKHRELPGTWI
jgi:hypothetical protein